MTELDISSTIAELEWYEQCFNLGDPIKQLQDYLHSDSRIPGTIILENENFVQLISSKKFHELMGMQYRFELFSKRDISALCELVENNTALILDSATLILEAASIATERNESNRFDPIIISFGRNKFALLDFYHLLSAQIQVHNRTLKSLREANDFKKEILGILAHDLRNPLNVIQGFSQALKEDNFEQEEIKEYAEYIFQSSTQMNGLLNEMLASATEDAKQISINLSTFDPYQLIRIVTTNFHPMARVKNQQILFETDEEQTLINGDKVKIQEVIENLISNAIKYSPPGEFIKVKAGIAGDILKFTVADNGPGLGKEDLRKIFGKFQRLSSKPTGNEPSTGLGLYITKKIVDLHLGKILVNSKIGCGSEFIVELPLNKENVNV